MAYAVETISSLPFGQLIGGPLVAGIEAQAQAAKTTVDFILQIGFQPPTGTEDPFLDSSDNEVSSPDIGSVRMITFNYQTTDANGTNTASITVPLLSVIPIPFFAIEEMTIDFMAKITESVISNKKSNSTSLKKASTHAKAGWGPFSAGLKASYSNKHSSSASTTSKYQTELTMNIHARATQNDMPAGMAKVLEILAGIIQESRTPTTTTP